MHWTSGDTSAAVAAASAISLGSLFLWRRLRGLARFLDDWHGTDSRPGVMNRLANVEQLAESTSDLVRAQLRPNGGASLYDKVTRIDDSLPPPAPEIHIHTDGGSG